MHLHFLFSILYQVLSCSSFLVFYCSAAANKLNIPFADIILGYKFKKMKNYATLRKTTYRPKLWKKVL